jgi:FKBP-type peptidyl-prolyl cis-trans isomerase FkpA
MKAKFTIALAALFISSVAFAQKKAAPVKFKIDKATGMEYFIVAPHKGEKIKEGQIAFVNLSYKTSKDSVMFDSWKMSTGPLQIKVTKPTFKGDLMDALKLLAEKDSAVILMSADSTFQKTFGADLPPFVEKGSKLTFIVKVERVTTEEVLHAEELKTKNEKAMQEVVVIDKYIADNNLTTVTTASGLKYVMIKEGTGVQATAGKTVSVHYTGKLLDGTKFDSSLDRNQPLEFQLGQGMVIKGWDEGIALLKVGGKALLIIPSELAYGARGAGGVIPPFSPLTFEVELVDVK